MSTTEREVLNLTPEQFEDVEESFGWLEVTKEHYDKRRWCDVWRYVVQNEASGKFYAYYGEVYSGDYESGDDSNTPPELTQVFPKEVTTIKYV